MPGYRRTHQLVEEIIILVFSSAFFLFPAAFHRLFKNCSLDMFHSREETYCRHHHLFRQYHWIVCLSHLGESKSTKLASSHGHEKFLFGDVVPITFTGWCNSKILTLCIILGNWIIWIVVTVPREVRTVLYNFKMSKHCIKYLLMAT